MYKFKGRKQIQLETAATHFSLHWLIESSCFFIIWYLQRYYYIRLADYKIFVINLNETLNKVITLMTHFPLHCTFTLPQLLCTDKKIGFQDTHGQNILSNKTEALTKSMNMNIWAIGTLNQLIVRGSYTEIKFSKK